MELFEIVQVIDYAFIAVRVIRLWRWSAGNSPEHIVVICGRAQIFLADGSYVFDGFGLHARDAIYYPAFRRIFDKNFGRFLFRAIDWMMAGEFLATYKTLLTVRSVLLFEEPVVIWTSRFQPFFVLAAAF